MMEPPLIPTHTVETHVDPAQRLIYALAAADRTLEALTPTLKRALDRERRPLGRDPRGVRREVELARRLAGELSCHLIRAQTALPASDAS